MTESFSRRQMIGAHFEQVRLDGATFTHVDLSGAHFRDVLLRGATFQSAYVEDVAINGEIVSLLVNGIDVAPLVEAELTRRHPELALLRSQNPDDLRRAWTVLEEHWAETVERAKALDPALLHESVDDEWSFIQTLRHLVFATDSWVNRVLLGDPNPWHPLDLPFDEMEETPGVPWDRDAKPSLDEVITLRASRQATVRRVLDDLTPATLASTTTPVLEPGWPEARSFRVHDVLSCVLNEEWWHRQYAERDLDHLTKH